MLTSNIVLYVTYNSKLRGLYCTVVYFLFYKNNKRIYKGLLL